MSQVHIACPVQAHYHAGASAIAPHSGRGRAFPQCVLSDRQDALYDHLCDLWRPIYVIDGTTGAPAATTYTIAARAERCYRKTLDSFSDPNLAGRQEGDNMFTVDQWHFCEAQEIDEGWIIRDVSENDAGTPAQTYGICWVTRGQPVRISAQGGRESGHTHIRASQLPANGVPSGVA